VRQVTKADLDQQLY